MTCAAQCYQIFFRIIARMAAEFLVVNLKIGHRTAGLAPPVVTVQHSQTKFVVYLTLKVKARTLGQELVHDAFALK